jgi:hypothetical protein
VAVGHLGGPERAGERDLVGAPHHHPAAAEHVFPHQPVSGRGDGLIEGLVAGGLAVDGDPVALHGHPVAGPGDDALDHQTLVLGRREGHHVAALGLRP